MNVYNLYIFNRNGICIYYHEWDRNKESNLPLNEEFKLMYGMLFSLKSFVNRLSPTDQKEGLVSYSTTNYKMNFYETASGLKFIMNTGLKVGNIRDTLHQLYSQVFVEYIDKNAVCDLNSEIKSDLFSTKINEFVSNLPFFSATN